ISLQGLRTLLYGLLAYQLCKVLERLQHQTDYARVFSFPLL
ncbi:hypothetical protein BMETH_3697112470, partial [methanotrophic bacterial endosymbiont of Bathymodiolus sp.]